MKKLLSLFFILLAAVAFSQDLPNTPDDSIETLQFSFTGQWLPSVDPIQVGPENYRKLQNLRYTPAGSLESVGGYSKINTTVITDTPEVDGGFHYKKDNPAETHVLIRGDDGIIYPNTTAIPIAGDFTSVALHTDSSGAGSPRFSNAPYGQMAYANGVETMIWGGTEMPCAAFLTSTAAITNSITDPKDFTVAVNNDLTSASNVVPIAGGGIVLLLHMDGADTSTIIPDSSISAHGNASAEANAQLDTGQYKFGTASLMLDGTGDYIHYSDSANWTAATAGDYTIDFWVRHAAMPGVPQGYFRHWQDSSNYIWCHVSLSGANYVITAGVTKGTATTVELTGSVPTGDWSKDEWHHIALIKGWNDSTSTYAITFDGVVKDTDTDAGAWPAVTNDFEIGRVQISADVRYLNGWIDEFRITKGQARWTTGFTPPGNPDSASAQTWIIGSPRPLQGVKYYVDVANTVASTMTAKQWNGIGWESLTITDNTDDGPALAETGTVTWDSTVGSSKVKFLDNRLYYWYQFALDDGGATIYRVTLDAPFQPLVDLWDGVYRQPIQFQVYDASMYEDYTLEVNDPLATYYGDLGGLESTEWLIVMSDDRLTALQWVMVAGTENTTAATVTIYYWDGEDWASVGTVSDTTLDAAGGTDSLGQSGNMSWQPPDAEIEFMRTLFGTTGYAYKLVWSDTLLADNTHVNTLTGVPAQLEVPPFKFPVLYRDRLFLCGYTEGGEGNRCDFSVTNTAQAFNGQESSGGYSADGATQSIYLGGNDELTAGVEIYNRMGSNIFDFLVLLKENETYVVYGDGPVFSTSMVSQTVGCPAPATVVTGAVAFEVSKDVERNIAMWVSYNGPIVFDGAAIYKVPGLETYFDPNSANYLGQTAIVDAIGFFDQTYGEYNFIVGSKWFAYNLKQKKWFLKSTGAAETPISAWPVRDIYGNQYVYAGRDDGYVVRLEYGTTWDGTGITQEVQTGDFFPTKNMWDLSRLRRVKIVLKRIADPNGLQIVHYADGDEMAVTDFVWVNTSDWHWTNTGSWVWDGGNSVLAMDLAGSDTTNRDRMIRMTQSCNLIAWAHALRFEITTSDSEKAFQPLAWGVEYIKEWRDH